MNTCWLFIVCLCYAGASVFAEDTGKAVRQERLAKYSFVRTEYDPGAIGLLIGNTELGGMANASGLAIPKVFGGDLWKNPVDRMSVKGPELTCAEFPADRKPTAYRQELGLADGVIRTRAVYEDGGGYEAELFCSMADRHLVVLRVKNLGGTGQRVWRLVRPVTDYTVTNPTQDVILGQTTRKEYTRDAWAVRLSKGWTTDSDGHEIVKLSPGETLTLVYSCTTQWDGEDYVQLCRKTVSEKKLDDKRLVKDHGGAWASLWGQSATLAIPDPALERMWYRSLFWTLSTCGSGHFLPGESMFGVDCWGMRPFTYGAAGWAVHALMAAGFPDQARAMLDWHLKPEALRNNAEFYTKALTGKSASPDAWSFAHEVQSHGQHNPCDFWELQRHVDGFGATLFYRYNRLYPDAKYYSNTVYPVLRGVSAFYKGMVSLDEKSGQYILPKMTSLTEDLSAIHPIDAALAAKWCLVQAARTAEELNLDSGMRESWKDVAGKLCIPQNNERYLEYFGDEEKRAGGGYMGVRGFVYLSYPTQELRSLLDHDKVVKTLDYTWIRNKHGEGMIGFVANWFALADTHYGRGEHALSVMKHNLKCVDKWETSVSETPGNGNYYFTTGYASYIPVPLSMAVQSAEDRISVFPAVPAEWKDFAFYNVPAEDGIRVSGEMKEGKFAWVSYHKDGKELLRQKKNSPVRIRHKGKAIRLSIE